MIRKIKKAILPVAGLGTRTLPTSKSVPKELFPILNKPVIQYLVEEVVSAGIEEIIMVISPEKEILKKYFSRDQELEKIIEQKGKSPLLKDLNHLIKKIKFSFCYQEFPHGDGHAILCAEDFIEDEAVAVLFGDDLVLHEKSGLQQLMEIYEKVGDNVLALTEISNKDSEKYGMVGYQKNKSSILEIKQLVEKPKPENSPSNMAIIGKYIISANVIKNLKKAKSSHGGEIRLIDGLSESLKNSQEKIYGCPIKGERFDTGNFEGLLEANIGYALKSAHFKKIVNKAIK